MQQKSLLHCSYITYKGMPEGYVHMVAILSLTSCPAPLVVIAGALVAQLGALRLPAAANLSLSSIIPILQIVGSWGRAWQHD